MMRDAESFVLPCGVLGLLISLSIGTVILRRVFRVAPAAPRTSQFHHQLHPGKIPRVGGLCIVAGFLAAALLAGWVHHWSPLLSPTFMTIAGTSLAIFGVGILDDIRPLGAKRKLTAQLLVAGAAYYLGIEITSIKCKLKLSDIYNRVKFPSAKGLLSAVESLPKPATKKAKRSKSK